MLVNKINMAAESWDKDLILANYQAASANEDITSSITALENYNWDLQAALNAHFLVIENENREGHHKRRSPSPIEVDRPPYIDLDPDPFMRNDSFDVPTVTQPRILRFQILWQERTIQLSVADTETVGSLKKMVEIQSGLSQSSFNLEGWSSGDSHHDNTILSSLDLSEETHLALHLPAKVTVSPAEYKPCNIPACRAPMKRHSASPDSPPRIIDVQIDDKPEVTLSNITLTVNHEGRDYHLKYKPRQTVKEVKQELYLLTNIATKYQEWTGWPPGTLSTSELGDLQLSPHHFLLLSSQPGPSSSRDPIEYDVAPSKYHMDSGMDGTPEDTDVEEHIISDDDDETLFDTDATHSKRLTPLIPRDAADSSETIIKLQAQFEERYGDFHPVFFMGPLKDAIEEAAGPTVDQRRPLLVYLHHDGSILTNIFCSQILCSEQVVSYISQNFVIWPWDMTYESNRQRFVNMLVQHFGNTAANSVSKFPNGEYPLLLIVMKSKAGLEVCSVLQANTSLDELMMALISGYEVFEQTKSIEVKAEHERLEREQMKSEQDAAYEESLAVDRAKAEAEKSRVQQECEEQKQAQMDAQIKEAERISCEEQLPEEPPISDKNATKIVFRLPYGARELRRFHNDDTLRAVFMYVASKGFSLDEYRVVTNFPRKELKQDGDMHRTLKELNLCPQQTLFVEEI